MLPKPHTPTPADRPPPPLLISVLPLDTTTCPPVYRCASLLAATSVPLVTSDLTYCHPYIRKFMHGDFNERPPGFVIGLAIGRSGFMPEQDAFWRLAIRFANSAHLTWAVLPWHSHHLKILGNLPNYIVLRYLFRFCEQPQIPATHLIE